MMNSRQTESGRSMIEMLGVLAIIGVLSVGGIAGYSKAMMKFKVNKTVDEVTQIATNVRTLFGGQRDYSALKNAVINKGHLVPDEMVVTSGTGDSATSTYENAWGNPVVVFPADKVAAKDKKAFLVSFAQIPTEACLELAVMDWGSSSGSGLVAFGVGDDGGIKSSDTSAKKTIGKAVAAITVPNCASISSSDSGYVCANGKGDGRVPMNPAQAADLCSSNTGTGTVNMYWKFY